jgi:hypothetical protein
MTTTNLWDADALKSEVRAHFPAIKFWTHRGFSYLPSLDDRFEDPRLAHDVYDVGHLYSAVQTGVKPYPQFQSHDLGKQPLSETDFKDFVDYMIRMKE